VTEFRVGQFVKSYAHRLGVGKILRVSGENVEIEYFDSISPTSRCRVMARRIQVKPVQVSLQRRCYWEDEAGWRVGRVVWVGGREYGVRPPNSDLDLMVPEEQLYVRWNKPITDPVDVLVARGNESPYFHLRRRPFVAAVMAQRAASHGMHGVVSSVIDLYDHQIEVARRVLEDPKQRYLLADEVGLGKTIEAGIVIRQYLLDHPNGYVVVIAPPLLRRQWVTELRQKFLIDDFDRAVISVLAHNDPLSWQGGARDGLGRRSLHRNAGLVVVDEVHHLAAMATSRGADGDTYATLAQLTASVPRLLLLSATPLLNNERTFLAMLHLLDPDIYRLSDVDGFRRRIRDRQALGTAFFTFRHDIPAFLLREKVAALRAMFPDDEQLATLLDRVLATVSDPSALPDAVMAARIHISETYRVYRRLLRTRRTEGVRQ
jgi:ATP-dependent helicase HepA